MNTKIHFSGMVILLGGLLLASCGTNSEPSSSVNNGAKEAVKIVSPSKMVIYQAMVRLFGNKNTVNKKYGRLEENGVGTFRDFHETALKEIRNLGITHIWYTGVIEHATMYDISLHGIPIPNDDADVVKGRAGSPYAIKDYYDVNPYLAAGEPENRMKEFEELVLRTHNADMKVLIDFVPNHVARNYKSDALPKGAVDLGEKDDITKAFDPQNNFLYLPENEFVVPAEHDPLGPGEKGVNEDGKFSENPAKVTGNNVFSASPSVHDWFETVKLNYGVDYQEGESKHFDPIPATWTQMRDILLFWAGKGVDGFRCDMAEMVPVEFWAWAIPSVKSQFPEVVFIAEIYNPSLYTSYIQTGKFDYLYDKVGVYDHLRGVMEGKKEIDGIHEALKQSAGIEKHMLRFLENHDEQRIASDQFAGDPWKAVPAMAVSTLLSSGPTLIYFGQEVGEPGKGEEGFQGEDGRTTIFDFWGVPEHQKWMANGAFDGEGLSPEQRKLRNFYGNLFLRARSFSSVLDGKMYPLDLETTNGPDKQLFSFARINDKQVLISLNNFGDELLTVNVHFSAENISKMGFKKVKIAGVYDLTGKYEKIDLDLEKLSSEKGNPFELQPWGAKLIVLNF